MKEKKKPESFSHLFIQQTMNENDASSKSVTLTAIV